MQTFVSIWWLKQPKKSFALIAVGIQWIFAVTFVGVAYGLHSHPPREYYATPTPVCKRCIGFPWFKANSLTVLVLD
jgi:hypothetical protein